MSRRDSGPLAPRAGAALLLLVVAVVGAACGSGRARNPFDGSVAMPGTLERIHIEVQNLNFNDVTVYALRASQRIRIGRVTGKTDATFTIEWNVAQTIAFRVDAIGGDTCRTGYVIVDADARVWLTVPSEMRFDECRAGRR